MVFGDRSSRRRRGVKQLTCRCNARESSDCANLHYARPLLAPIALPLTIAKAGTSRYPEKHGTALLAGARLERGELLGERRNP